MEPKRKIFLSFAMLIVMTLVVKTFGFNRIESMSIPGIGFSSLLVNAGMMMLTIRGYQWARITLGVLMFLSALVFLIAIFVSTNELGLSLILLMFFMIHCYIGNFLLRDTKIKAFIESQRKKYQ